MQPRKKHSFNPIQVSSDDRRANVCIFLLDDEIEANHRSCITTGKERRQSDERNLLGRHATHRRSILDDQTFR